MKTESNPIAGEFALCQEQQNLGLRTDAALRELARRTGLTEIRMFVVASLVHRESGGNFADLLENLSFVVRERFRIRGVVQSLTAEGRRVFRTMARTHEDWIAEIFAGLAPDEIDTLMSLLAKTKASARKAVNGSAE